jgi:hypothetical protein
VAAVSLQPCADFSLLGRLLSVARSFSLCLAGGMPAAAVWAGRGLPVPPPLWFVPCLLFLHLSSMFLWRRVAVSWVTGCCRSVLSSFLVFCSVRRIAGRWVNSTSVQQYCTNSLDLVKGEPPAAISGVDPTSMSRPSPQTEDGRQLTTSSGEPATQPIGKEHGTPTPLILLQL